MLEPTDMRSVVAAAHPHEFEAVFQEEYPRLARACYLLTGDATEAEDLAQEAFARAFERWDRVALMDSSSGYLYMTAFNLNRKRLRHLAVTARRRIGATPPVDPAAIAETRSDLHHALARLPREQREALILVGWLEMDSSEAARVLGIKPASVRGRVHRARRALRERLGEDDHA